uniref:Globin domain-containing protein n=1 Tax=Monopterus albus TaxID=43700 RepID=A0A3Q3R9P8_MONAL
WSNGQVLSATPSHPWAKIDAGETGRQALERALKILRSIWQPVHRCCGNPKVAAHGKAVMGGLEKAVKNLDDIKNTYKSLSVMHSEKLHVDPDNFRVCYWPFRLHPDVQEAWHKFLSVVVSALGSTTEMQYK